MKKLMNKKGFTLMEMLIVIAIIVILVAIAVPSFTSSLNSAKAATDEANLRAAKSAAQIKAVETKYKTGEHFLYYDLTKGDVLDLESDATPTATDANYKGSCTAHSSAYIKVVIKDGVVTSVDWNTGDACK